MAEIAVLYFGPVVTINEARERGEKRYFTGKPCINGHVEQRIVSSNGCLACDLSRKKKKYIPLEASKKKRKQKECRDAKRITKTKPPLSLFYSGPIVTRAEAIERGLKRYFVGEPCEEGHVSQRQTSKDYLKQEGRCIQCVALYREKKRAEAAGRPRSMICDICGGDGKTVFDHCHTHGHFRGWLCNDCNAALGFAKDSPELLRKMAEYLERTGVEANGQTQEFSSNKHVRGA